MRAFVQAGRSAAEGGANQRAFLTVDDPADSRAGAGAAADDQRGLAPWAVRARGPILRDFLRAIWARTVRAAAHALDSGDRFAADERVAHDRVLTRPAGDDDRRRERLGAA